MKAIEFCNLAVSKDETRFNLCEVFRDKTEIVGCDGHRLHWSNGLPEVTPHYPSGLSAEYPDWRQVLPSGSPTGECTIIGSAIKISTLNKFLSLLKDYSGKSQCVKLEAAKGLLKISFEESQDISISILIPADVSLDFIVGIELRYLIDALKPIDKTYNIVKLQAHGELNPILVSYLGSDVEKFHAVLMPMRLKK